MEETKDDNKHKRKTLQIKIMFILLNFLNTESLLRLLKALAYIIMQFNHPKNGYQINKE